MSATERADWWARNGLGHEEGRLVFAGRDCDELARQFGTPTFLYDASRILDNTSRLHKALLGAGFADRFRILYAMKANRFQPLLTLLKTSGLVGIDTCSPNEVDHAIASGFRPDEISFTAGSLSSRDLERLARFDDLGVNCDSLTALRWWGANRPGREIGIRINPARGVGRAENDKLQYSGLQTSKFGIYREQFGEALEVAAQHGLVIRTIHFHTGCGFLTEQLEAFDQVLESAEWFIEQVPTLRSVNVGGGLGVPHVGADHQLDLTRWAGVLAKHFADTDLMIEVEPGDFLVKDAGMLLLEVTGSERKQATTFVGLSAGFNIALEPVVYSLPFEPVVAVPRQGAVETVTLHGNINEAWDIWYRDVELAPLQTGDIVALLNAGGYSSSMASNHCMRGEFKEILLLD